MGDKVYLDDFEEGTIVEFVVNTRFFMKGSICSIQRFEDKEWNFIGSLPDPYIDGKINGTNWLTSDMFIIVNKEEDKLKREISDLFTMGYR